jgi:hypothetical protein
VPTFCRRAAHGIVQLSENDATAAWIHAVRQKIEGDPINNRYWYVIHRLADFPKSATAGGLGGWDRAGWT